jgi:hypothetical protein
MSALREWAAALGPEAHKAVAVRAWPASTEAPLCRTEKKATWRWKTCHTRVPCSRPQLPVHGKHRRACYHVSKCKVRRLGGMGKGRVEHGAITFPCSPLLKQGSLGPEASIVPFADPLCR